MPDIDIDFADRSVVLDKIKHRVAKLDTEKKHNTGVYVTEIPHNPVDMLSTIDYEKAEDRGYFKLDFLNVSLYKDIKDEEHLLRLMKKEPMWELLQHEEFTDQLFHLNGHGTVVKKLCPTSVEQLASVLAIIRPAKRHLVNKTWNEIEKQVLVKPSDSSYYFKKAHAVAYDHVIVVQMNLLCEGVTYDN